MLRSSDFHIQTNQTYIQRYYLLPLRTLKERGMQRELFSTTCPAHWRRHRQSFPIEGIESLSLEEFKPQLLSDAWGPQLASVKAVDGLNELVSNADRSNYDVLVVWFESQTT